MVKSTRKTAEKVTSKSFKQEKKPLESGGGPIPIKQSDGSSGQRRDFSSTSDSALPKRREEQPQVSKLTIQLAPARPGSDFASQDIISFESQSESVVSELLINSESKKIRKAKKDGKRSRSPQPSTNQLTTSNPTRTATVRVRRVNHGKYTVKTPSNYLRKELKKYGFNFERYEGKNHNKRGTAIYLILLLLELKDQKKERFPEFIGMYKRELDVMIWKKIRLQELEGRSEKNEKYIEYFQRAKVAADKFVRNDYLGAIKAYFGIGKERFYLDEGIALFNQRRYELGDKNQMFDKDDEIFDVLTL